MSEALPFNSHSFEPTDETRLSLDEPRPFAAHFILSLLFLGFGAVAKISDETSETGSELSFPVLCWLVVAYAVLQIVLLRRFQPQLWLVNPAVQSALFVHFVPTISVLVVAVLPVEYQQTAGFNPWMDQWAVQYEWLNLLGAVALWTGYWSGLANGLAKMLAGSRFLATVVRPSLEVNTVAALALILIACAFRLVAISLGVYGYSSSYDALIAASRYTEYLFMASALGRVALVGASLAYFHSGKGLWLVWALVALETAFGLLSGFKSAVVIPIIIVGLAYYAVRSKIPKWLLPVAIAGIFGAYAVIEPFRAARNEEFNFDGTSLFSIIDTFSASRDAAYAKSDADGAFTATAVSLLSRTSDVASAAPGIEFAARVDALPEGSPEFLKDIFLSPLYSMVPRLVWDTKPVNALGLWYNRVVIGSETMSSTAMYPVTYLNFAGGWLAVFLGFFAVGVIQSTLFRGLLAHGGASPFLLLCLVTFMGHIDSVYYSFYVALLRNIPLLLLLQWMLFSPALPSIQAHRQ